MSNLVEKSVQVESQSPVEELEHLKNNEMWLKDQIKKPDNYLHSLYGTNTPKKDIISQWALNLERQHELEIKLKRTTTLKSIGHISSYVKSELRTLGVHSSTLSYVHEILGYKYKNENKNRYQSEDDDDLRCSTSQSSSIPIANFLQENESILLTISDQIDFLKNYRNKARSSHIISKLNDKQLLEYEEMNLRTKATIVFADQIIDDRQSVPTSAQLKLVMSVVASTNNFAAGMYVSQIKQFGSSKMQESKNFQTKITKPLFQSLSTKNQKLYEIAMGNIKLLNKEFVKIQKAETPASKKTLSLMTSKQAMKIVFGVVKKTLNIFDHKTRDEAILDGFYGVQCPECGSMRVKEKTSGSSEWLCFCYKCEALFEARTVIKCWQCHIPFFEDVLEVILKNSQEIIGKDGKETGARESKCPRCDEGLTLPSKMFKIPVLRSR